ncbi:MAG TPA: hypothetical protein VGM39_26565 [Kofleriaceae bacterium]
MKFIKCPQCAQYPREGRNHRVTVWLVSIAAGLALPAFVLMIGAALAQRQDRSGDLVLPVLVLILIGGALGISLFTTGSRAWRDVDKRVTLHTAHAGQRSP